MMLPAISTSDKGFSLVELILVIALILILGTMSIPLYGNLQGTAQLGDNSAQIVQAIRSARQRSVSRFNNSEHGVYFEINEGVDRYILYQGDSYATRNTNLDRSIILDSSLSVATSLVGSEVNFSRGLGVPNNTGNVVLSHATNGSRTMVINSLGMVENQ